MKVTLHEALAWIKNKHGAAAAEITDSTFYNLRKRMSLEPVSMDRAIDLATPRPSIQTLVAEAETPPRAHHPAQPQDNGIAALVRQLKHVVTKIGKDETKQLIDVL